MIRVLLAMVACQAAAALAAFTLPLGLVAELVGYYTTLMLGGAMLATAVTAGFVRRYGALRVSQATLVFAALGAGRPALRASAVSGPARPAGQRRADRLCLRAGQSR